VVSILYTTFHVDILMQASKWKEGTRNTHELPEAMYLRQRASKISALSATLQEGYFEKIEHQKVTWDY
jgi:hypothetical protein